MDAITRTVYRRALQGKSTSTGDVMGDVILMTRYAGTVTTDAMRDSDMGAAECYARTLLRRVVDAHPAMSGRIEI